MQSLPGRTAATVCLLGLVTLSISPNLVLLAKDPSFVWFVRGVVISGMLLAALLGIFRRRPWIPCLFLVPFATCAPAEAFYIARYGRASDANIIATLFESNLREAGDFLGDATLYLALAMALSVFLAVATVIVVRASGLSINAKFAHWILAITVGVPAVVLAGAVLHPAPGQSRFAKLDETAQRLSLETYGTYPFGVIGRFTDYLNEAAEMRRVTDSLKDFHFGAHRVHDSQSGRIVVLVIGESSRRNHWQLFGYERATTPQLAATKNLIPITDMVTPWAASRLAVPEIITRKPAVDEDDYFLEPPVSRVFAEAGFETFWYSTQVAVSYYDSPISVAAFDAKKVGFFSFLGTEGSVIHDDALIAPLQHTVDTERGDLFIVLHTMGSHLGYISRYPPEFDHFKKPRADALDDEFSRIENTYDNSVLFTDNVLAKFIDVLRRSNRVATLMYTSDHGEMLPNADCHIGGHGFPGLPVYPVPAFFWFSDEYRRAYPKKVETIAINASAKTQTTNMFETLVDAADLDFPGHDPRKSLFSTDFTESTRVVNAQTHVDFDNKVLVGACEVVTRGRERASTSPRT